MPSNQAPISGDSQTAMSEPTTTSSPFLASSLASAGQQPAASPNAPEHKPRQHFGRLFLACIILCVSFLAILIWGFILFASNALHTSSDFPQKADAIVVVTGGKGRLEAAGTLFNKNLGKKLLISGVHPKFKMENLPKNLKVSSQQMLCCIDLDRRALNTVANATQTAQWAQKHKFDSLIIVTSAYHMSRTLLEMRRAAPDITFQSYSVPNPSTQGFWSRLTETSTLKLLVKEYGKLLLAFFQLSSERLAK